MRGSGKIRSLNFVTLRRDEPMKKNILILLVLVAMAFYCSGCQQKEPQEFTQTQGGITATFTMKPASPGMMEPVRLSLSLTDASGQAIESAQVAYDLTMPGMSMPPNRPQASNEGNGLYVAETTFTMSGDWRAEATVTYNAETTTFTFDFLIK
jgi:hypothetical protein